MHTLLVIAAILLPAVAAPVILLILPLLCFMYRHMQRMYTATSRELKRLDSVAYSPIFSNFGELATGICTIRAFRKQRHFYGCNLSALSASNRCAWPILIINRWLSVRLELMGALFVLCTAVLVTGILP